MPTLEEVRALPNGAQFYTADLHVHSLGGSVDVTDPLMTVEAIVDMAVQEQISVLAITDHNTDKNSVKSVEYGRAKHGDKLLVLAAVEVTTAHGHLLAYFPPDATSALAKFLVKIDVVQGGTAESHTAKSMADVAAIALDLGGICVAAHIDREKTGFEMLAAGYPNWKKDIIGSPGIFGIEIDNPANLKWYSDDDDTTGNGAERRKLLERRAGIAGVSARPALGHFQNSDAHSLSSFRTAHVKRALTRLKMDALTFDGFRMALVDPEARTRAVVKLPPAVHRVLGMHVDGGFLGAQNYRFSDNLTCFIGGRGTGKSTALMCLAYAVGASDQLHAYDNCPNTVIAYCEDANGVVYRYERSRGGAPEVRAREGKDKVDVAPDAFRIEYYGQGHLAEVARDPLRNAALLQAFLDRHLHLADLQAREAGLRDELDQNSSVLRPLETQAAQRASMKTELDALDQKLKVAEDGKLKEVAAVQVRLGAEKGLAKSIDEIRVDYRKGVTLNAHLRNFDEMVATSGALTGDAECDARLAAIKKIVEDTNEHLKATQKAINRALQTAAAGIETERKALAARHGDIDKTIGERVSELRKAGLAATIADLKKLVDRRAAVAGEIAKIDAKAASLKKTREDRKRLLGQLQEVRAAIMSRRTAQIAQINAHVVRAIDDYQVTVVYEPDGLATPFVELVLEVMHGSWFKDEMAQAFCNEITPQAFAAAVDGLDVALLENVAAIGTDWATQLIQRFSVLQHLNRLEVLWKPPRPDILVLTKAKPSKRIPVAQLSDGQKHTILLTIAMLGESEVPLVIDQPEDDLDNAFIYSSVVRVLRSVKEKRQVILVTHNANIAVLGDAELLFPMRRDEDHGATFAQGSIDRPETKQAVQDILEGGELAFLRRKEIYGQ